MAIKSLFYVLACYIIRKRIVFELFGTLWAVQLYIMYIFWVCNIFSITLFYNHIFSQTILESLKVIGVKLVQLHFKKLNLTNQSFKNLKKTIYKAKFSISWTDFIVLAPGNSNYLKVTAITRKHHLLPYLIF